MRHCRMPLLTTVLMFMVLLSGCAQYAHQVRNAQDSFSHGAGLELARKFNMEFPGVSDPVQESHRYYALAVGTVNEALRDGARALKQDSLYGTALTIKALALWRLGDTAASGRVAQEVIDLAAQQSATNKVWPRDLGICKSLPILFKIDALADQTSAFAAQHPDERKKETIERIVAHAQQTDNELDQVVNNPILQGHPFQFYLAEARCELANVLQEAAAATAVFPDNGAAPYYQAYNNLRSKALADLQGVVVTHNLGAGFQARVDKMHSYYSRVLQTLP